MAAKTKTVTRYRSRPAKRRRSRKSSTVSMSLLAGIVAGMYAPATYLAHGDLKNTMRFVSRNYTGYDPMEGNWHIYDIRKGLVPLMIGAAVHKVAGKVGINRAIGRSGIPFIRI